MKPAHPYLIILLLTFLLFFAIFLGVFQNHHEIETFRNVPHNKITLAPIKPLVSLAFWVSRSFLVTLLSRMSRTY